MAAAHLLPLDRNGNALPVLGLQRGQAQHMTVTTGSSSRSDSLGDATAVIALYPTTAMHIELGDDTVTATTASHFLPAGLYTYLALPSHAVATPRHIAARAADSDGTLHVSECA